MRTVPRDSGRSWHTDMVKPGQGCGLLAGETADLRHAHQDGDRSLEPDAIHAFDEVEPFSQIAVLADGRHQLLELSP